MNSVKKVGTSHKPLIKSDDVSLSTLTTPLLHFEMESKKTARYYQSSRSVERIQSGLGIGGIHISTTDQTVSLWLGGGGCLSYGNKSSSRTVSAL
jgi:DNA relaxase NicK